MLSLISNVLAVFANIGLLVFALSLFESPPDFDDLVVTQGTLISVSDCVRSGRNQRVKIVISRKHGEIKESFGCLVDMSLLKDSIDTHIEVRRHEGWFFESSLWHIESDKGVIFSYKKAKEADQNPLFVFLKLSMLAAFFYLNFRYVKDLFRWIDTKIGTQNETST